MANARAGGHDALDRRDAQANAHRQQQHVEQPRQRLNVQPVGVRLVDTARRASGHLRTHPPREAVCQQNHHVEELLSITQCTLCQAICPIQQH